MRALTGCVLPFLLMCWSGCGSSGGSGASLPPTASNPGAGFNQARGFNEPVTQILPIPDGSGDVYVLGDFTTYGDRMVRPIVRLRPNGRLNAGFTLADSVAGNIASMALVDDGSGDLYVADYSLGDENSATMDIGHIRRVHADGTINPVFALATVTAKWFVIPSNPLFKPVVRSLTPVGDGSARLYAAVEGQYNGTPVGAVVRLLPNGDLDPTFDARSLDISTDLHVWRIVPVNDGSKKVYGVIFAQVSPAGYRSIGAFRLNVDGTLDPSFDIPGDGLIEGSAISLLVPVNDGSGDLFAVVNLANLTDPLPFVNPIRGLVRINPNGALDLTSPRPQIDLASTVMALAKAIDGSGDWFVAQEMSLHNIQVVRFKADGTRHPTFMAVQFDGPVKDIAGTLDGSGDVYVGGQFLAANGTGVNQFVRLNSDGTQDSGTLTGSGFNGNGFPINVAPVNVGGGSLYATGLFTSYNGAITNHVTRLTATGQHDTTFSSGSGFGGLGFRVIPLASRDGTARLYVGGDFSAYDGQPVSPLVRLLPSGTRDSTFTPEFNIGSVIETIAAAEDDTTDLYAGGQFSSYNGMTVNGAVRIHPDGSRDRGFDLTLPPGIVRQIVPTLDGSGDIYVRFQPLGGLAQLLRLNRDGTVDESFAAPEPYGSQAVTMTILSGSGNLMVASLTTNPNGTYQSHIVRLTPDGRIDVGFNLVTLDGVVFSMAIAEEAAGLYVGGTFTTVNGTASPGIVRLNQSGMRDPSFMVGAGFNGFVRSIERAPDASGDIFVGGTFTRYQSTTMQGIARLSRVGTAE